MEPNKQVNKQENNSSKSNNPESNNPESRDPDSSNPESSNSESRNPESRSPESRNLRRKRCAIGSMEDLWDESIFEEPRKIMSPLNIPPVQFTTSKEAKKALKKAKKEAKKFTKTPSPVKKKGRKKKHIHSDKTDSINSKKDIDIGDVVWAKNHRESWWPAKVISFTEDLKIEVKFFNRKSEGSADNEANPIKIKSDLIKPFLDLMRVSIRHSLLRKDLTKKI